jgi:hypothetical protein
MIETRIVTARTTADDSTPPTRATTTKSRADTVVSPIRPATPRAINAIVTEVTMVRRAAP